MLNRISQPRADAHGEFEFPKLSHLTLYWGVYMPLLYLQEFMQIKKIEIACTKIDISTWRLTHKVDSDLLMQQYNTFHIQDLTLAKFCT